MKILKTEFEKGTQSVNLEQIIESDEGLKIRLLIKSDSYQFQSKAKVEVFNVKDLSWNFVSSIHYSNMKTPEGMIYLPTVHPHKVINPDVAYPLMKDDLESLIKMAEDVLGQSFSIKAKKTKKAKMKSFFDTSFSISVQDKDEFVKTLSLSYDEENYVVLYNWLLKEYNSEEKAKALVDLKNINKFKENINDIEIVSSNLKPIIFNSLEDWNRNSLAEKNFIYIVKKDAWFVSEGKRLDSSKVILRKVISCVKDFNRDLYDELKILENVKSNSKKLDIIPVAKNKKNINL